MAAAVLSYSAERFNALPSLGAASDAFAPRKADVLPHLVAIIRRAGLADVAGVALLHAHFSMHADERLVQRGKVRPARGAACVRAAGRCVREGSWSSQRPPHRPQVARHSRTRARRTVHGARGQRHLRCLLALRAARSTPTREGTAVHPPPPLLPAVTAPPHGASERCPEAAMSARAGCARLKKLLRHLLWLTHSHARAAARLSQGVACPQAPTAGAFPTMFAFVAGAVAPLEFSSCDGAHYEAALRAVLAAPGFVSAYTQALAALGVDGTLGLALLPPAAECAPRGAQWVLEDSGPDERNLVTTVFAAGESPADATVLDGANDVVWVVASGQDGDAYATQRKCNIRNTACRDKPVDGAYATQRKCNIRITACRDKPVDGAYATQRKCNIRNTACRDKPVEGLDERRL